MNRERDEAVAGLFYPKNSGTLEREVKGLLSNSSPSAVHPIKILIVPHAGYSYSGQTAADSYIEIVKGKYKRVVLLGPSHHFGFNGIVSCDAKYWKNPTGKMEVEQGVIQGVQPGFQYHAPEHSLEVQIPLIHQILPDTLINPLLISGNRVSASKFAQILSPLDDKETLWVISSDFTHYGPRFGYNPKFNQYRNGEDLDKRALEIIQNRDISGFNQFLQETGATICGALPILIAMHLSESWDLPPFTLKKHTSSGAITGDYKDSVGYAAMYC